ncbi:hypothetical protein HYU07_07255 [Candidatus Woesearchaeota archaeon]|nr:hypothetical protein [Candidatus Woesearchaeota archaeon]
MKGAVEKREFYTGAILGFDAAIVSIDKLVADFNYKTVIENESETYNIAINFGINMLTAMTSLKAEELAKDETMNIYNCAREVMQKYAKKSNMEAEKILKLDKQFNQKIKSFKEWALKHQDELYNAAIEKAEALDRSHESLKDEFGSFSLTYSVILEEDRQSIQAALEKIDKTYSSAYATADESTKANFWEVQNTKNDKQ